MSYSELKERVHVMNMNGFKKEKGGPYRIKYFQNGFQKDFAMSAAEVISHVDLEGFLKWNRQQVINQIKNVSKGKGRRIR